VGNSIAVKHVVEPVSLSGLNERRGQTEGTLPFGALSGKWELTTVRVPGTDEVDLFDIRSSAKRER